jgi:hypothetical protein
VRAEACAGASLAKGAGVTRHPAMSSASAAKDSSKAGLPGVPEAAAASSAACLGVTTSVSVACAKRSEAWWSMIPAPSSAGVVAAGWAVLEGRRGVCLRIYGVIQLIWTWTQMGNARLPCRPTPTTFWVNKCAEHVQSRFSLSLKHTGLTLYLCVWNLVVRSPPS